MPIKLEQRLRPLVVQCKLCKLMPETDKIYDKQSLRNAITVVILYVESLIRHVKLHKSDLDYEIFGLLQILDAF